VAAGFEKVAAGFRIVTADFRKVAARCGDVIPGSPHFFHE